METTIGNGTTMETIDVQPKKNYWKTRVLSFVALAALTGSCGLTAREAYYMKTDGFAVPFVLGPDNDMVVQSALKMAEIKLQKGLAISEKKAAENNIANSRAALAKLKDMKNMGDNALKFSNTTDNRQVAIGGTDLAVLAEQKKALQVMLERQTALTEQAKKNYSSGAATQVEYQQQQQALDSIQVALFNNDHTKMQTDVVLGQAALGLQALNNNKNGNNSMPSQEVLTVADLMGRIEIQRLQADSVLQTQLAEKERVESELNDIEALEKQVMTRPIFAAINGTMNVLFVPYSQIDDVVVGTPIYDCVWGLVDCKKVGNIKGLVAGETMLQDPISSSQVRGVFMTIDINNSKVMQSKILRLRTSYLTLPKFPVKDHGHDGLNR